MRKFYFLGTLVLTALLSINSNAQDYSNKGKNFYISYPEHINGTGSIMGLYLTSDVNTNGLINDNGTLIPFTVTANTITTIFLGTGGGFSGPNSYIHLGNLQDGIKTGAAVHITSSLPIVVYAHIINAARSGATLVLPTNVWGKEYIAPSYANSGGNGTNMGYGEINVMASLPNTQVEITPSITTRNGARSAGVPYTITLVNPGDVYQVQFPQNTDLSGTRIKSVAGASGGCQPIAVISASTWSAINCGSGTGGDNFYQQLFPYGSWGKEFFTTPLKKTANPFDHNTDIVRVYVKDPTTVVQKTENGSTITLTGLTPGGFYEYETEFPTFIQADKTIQVFEYVKTQNCSSPQTQSDPEMIALSSVEQTINDITVYSAINTAVPGGNSAVTVHYINVIMKTANTGTFRINGNPPGSAFIPIPFTNYSYLKQSISPANPVSRLKADSGFSAYAYGFGNVESYGYNAGTNVRDLTQQLIIETQYGIETSPSVCTFSPFRFKVYFPDSTLTTPAVAIRFDSLRWAMSDPSIILPNNFPIIQRFPTIDSTNIRLGRIVNWYSIPGFYSFTTPGVDTLQLTTYRSTNEGCGTDLLYEFPIQISSPPTGSFTWTSNGCATQAVQFTETTLQIPKTTYRFWWDFGDPPSGPANNSTLRNPTHLFTGPGTYTVRYVAITTPGCLTDTITHLVTLDPPPTANFSVSPPFCPGVPVSFTDNSLPGGSSTINKWTWDFGDGSPVVIVLAPNPPSQTHIYVAPGTYNVTLIVETSTGCSSTLYTQQVTIVPDGTITLTSAPGTNNQTVCINTPINNITYAVGGSGTGGSVSGLPTGVTGNFAGGVITISGTPSISGVFNYTVTTTGPCVTPTATGTITVTADGTITLTSAAGTDNQTVCINTPITNITYAVGGSGTGGSVSGLPAGITGTFAGGVITISGSPSISGTFNYTVNTTGPCGTPSITGTITVTQNATITLTSAAGTNNQTVCINTPITTITYAVGGSGTGGSVSGLPAGVTGSFAGGVITITGTPSMSGIFNYTVSTTGPCGNPTATGTINVTADGSVTLTSAPGTDNQTACINTPIINITYAVGGSGTGGSVSGLPAGVTGSFAGGILTISGSPTVSGTFNYTVNTTGPCVNPTTTGTITVTGNATLTLTSAPGTDNQTVCLNTPITNITYLVGGGTGGGVSGLPAGVTGVYVGGVITISGSPSVTGTFIYTVTTMGPCGTPSTTGTITVNPNATITLTSAPPTTSQELCINATITNITYAIAGGGTGATVAGLPAGVNGVYAGGTFTISGTPVASGIFNYTVTTTGICVQATASGTITVNALPTANFNFTAPSCETRTISFMDMSVPNSGTIISWAWNFGDPPSGPNNTSSLQNPTHTYATTGTYTVTLVVTTNKGCVSTNPPVQVVINSRPQAGFILPEVCLNDTNAQFTDTSKVTAPDFIQGWDWDFGDGGTSTLQNPTHSYLATGSYNVRLIATSNRGCRDTIIQQLFVNGSFPVADFTVLNPTTLCANDSVAIVEASTVFPGTITKVEIYWDNVGQPGVFDTDNFPVTGKVYKHLYPNFQAPLTRTFTIRYRAYSGGVCVNDKLSNITVNAAPLVQFPAMPNICMDAAPYQIPPPNNGGVPGSGVFSGPGVSPTGLFSPAVAGPGTHVIKYKYTSSAGGCVDSATQTIKVWIPPTADFSTSAPACEKQAVTFSDNSGSTEGSLTQWRWDFNDGTPPVVRATGAAFTHIFNTYGTFNVTLNVVTTNGCVSAVKTYPVVVKPIARPNFRYPAVSCLPNANISFTNLSSIPDGTESLFTYLWNFGDPPSGPVNTSTGANPSHTYVGTGPYFVNLQVTSGAGCVHDTTITVTGIHPQPIGSFTTDVVDVCIGGTVTFTSTSTPADGTIVSWNWDMADGNIKTIPTFTYTYGAPGVYTVSHYIINSFNCKSSIATHTVSINPYPPVNAGPDKLMLEGGQVQLTPALNANMPVTYLWTPPTYLDNPNIASPIASPPDDITYKLTETTDKGCVASDSVFIKVLKKPDIPNIFSPNGDGIHDVWEIKYLETYPGCTIDIVNRYGQLVYHSVGYSKPWDGKIKGMDAPVGTYYYVVDPKNGRTKITGYVDIIR